MTTAELKHVPLVWNLPQMGKNGGWGGGGQGEGLKQKSQGWCMRMTKIRIFLELWEGAACSILTLYWHLNYPRVKDILLVPGEIDEKGIIEWTMAPTMHFSRWKLQTRVFQEAVNKSGRRGAGNNMGWAAGEARCGGEVSRVPSRFTVQPPLQMGRDLPGLLRN